MPQRTRSRHTRTSGDSSESAFGGRRRSQKIRERFAKDSSDEEARAILLHWHLEDKKTKEAKRELALRIMTHGSAVRDDPTTCQNLLCSLQLHKS